MGSIKASGQTPKNRCKQGIASTYKKSDKSCENCGGINSVNGRSKLLVGVILSRLSTVRERRIKLASELIRNRAHLPLIQDVFLDLNAVFDSTDRAASTCCLSREGIPWKFISPSNFCTRTAKAECVLRTIIHLWQFTTRSDIYQGRSCNFLFLTLSMRWLRRQPYSHARIMALVLAQTETRLTHTDEAVLLNEYPSKLQPFSDHLNHSLGMILHRMNSPRQGLNTLGRLKHS